MPKRALLQGGGASGAAPLHRRLRADRHLLGGGRTTPAPSGCTSRAAQVRSSSACACARRQSSAATPAAAATASTAPSARRARASLTRRPRTPGCGVQAPSRSASASHPPGRLNRPRVQCHHLRKAASAPRFRRRYATPPTGRGRLHCADSQAQRQQSRMASQIEIAIGTDGEIVAARADIDPAFERERVGLQIAPSGHLCHKQAAPIGRKRIGAQDSSTPGPRSKPQ